MQQAEEDLDSDKWYERIWPFKRKSKQVNGQETKKKKEMNKCVRLVIRPLRIFQFLVVLLIFVLIIYTITVAAGKLSTIVYILLIVFSGVYVFVLAVDVISQFSGGELHTVVTVKYDLTTSISNVRVPSDDENAIPDHCCRRVGYGRRRQYVDCPTSARRLTFVDVVDVQTEQRQTTDIPCQTQQQVREAPAQTVSRCELCNRKIQLSSSPSAVMQATTQQPPCTPCPALVQFTRGTPCCPGCRCVTGIIQVLQQSQQQQTQRLDQLKQDKEAVKEQKHWVQAVDEASYDTLTSNQRQSTDSELTGIGGTITKLTLASYCVSPKRTHTSSQTAASDVGRAIKKSTEPEEPKKIRINAVKKEKERDKVETKKKIDIVPAEKEKPKVTSNAVKKVTTTKATAKKVAETSATVATETIKVSEPPVEPAKTEEPELPVKEPVKYSTLDTMTEEVTDTPVKSIESIHETLGKIKPTKLISPPRQMADIIDRLQEIEGTKEKARQSKIANTSVKEQTQNDGNQEKANKSLNVVTEENADSTSICIKKDSDSNKMQSAQKKKMEDKECGSKCTGIDRTVAKTEASQETESTMKPRVPVASTLNLYLCVHKDKRGRVFCEHCAPPNTVKVLYKNVDQKRLLKCTACGNSLRMKAQNTSRNKADNCPHCGQMQMRAQAPVSA
ncbi:unnamed protein product [Xylocopa violacea]|uniref:Uncharacterized protein n=1 Tax=Xylocopa violacea TaxID=135666 RepID=A0ABP1MY96_XYLVO